MSRYLPTAFAQLHFAWKLYDYALDGRIDREGLDRPITFESDDQRYVWVLPEQIFENDDDFILAFQNNLTIAFGAASITLDRARHEAGFDLPDPIENEREQCIALIYQIRCAFAHDIAEPTWSIKPRYERAYEFGRMEFDLSNLHGEAFRYEHIGGPDRLGAIKDFANDQNLLSPRVR